jgi:hypothetical protein
MSSTRACRTCAQLVAPPVDPRATIEVTPARPPLQYLTTEEAATAFVDRLEPDHPLRRDHATLALIVGTHALRLAAAA